MNRVGTLFGLDWKNVEIHINPSPQFWRQEHGKTWCGHCSTLDRTLYPRPVDVFVERAAIRRCPIGMVSRTAIGFVRQDVRQVLSPWLGRFAVGRCFDFGGQLIDTHVTFYSSDYINSRYGPGSTYYECPRCGRVRPKQVHLPRYFVAYQLGTNEVIQEPGGTTFVRDEARSALVAARIPGLKIGEFPILERPIDGARLSTDPPDVIGIPPEPMEP